MLSASRIFITGSPPGLKPGVCNEKGLAKVTFPSMPWGAGSGSTLKADYQANSEATFRIPHSEPVAP